MGGWVPQAPAIPGVGPGYRKLIHANFDSDALENNVKWAQSAVTYTRMAIPYAGNKLEDIVVTGGGSFLAVAAMRISAELHSGCSTDSGYAEKLAGVKAEALRGREAGAGNCGEMSAVAFVYLLYSHVRPIELMITRNGDHRFVLIGRRNGEGWGDGPRCAVCDPWKKIAGPCKDLEAPSPLFYHEKDYKWFGSWLRIEDAQS